MRGSGLWKQGKWLVITESTGTQGDCLVTGMKQKFS